MTNLHIRRFFPLMITIAVIVLAGVAYFAWRHHHDSHGHAGHDVATLSLDDGKPWATDAPLRLGMQRIRDAVAGALAHQATGGLNPAQAKLLTTALGDNVRFLIQNCRLEPKADAVLHVFITELMEGSAMLEADPASLPGLEKLTHVLRQYPVYFQHPEWVPLPGVRP